MSWGPDYLNRKPAPPTGDLGLFEFIAIGFVSILVWRATRMGYFWTYFAIMIFYWALKWCWAFYRRRAMRPVVDVIDAADPLGSLRGYARRAGGGVFVGIHELRLVFSAAQQAVLLVGPPRSGKTSNVIIPSLICHQGPVVSTSTKPDVMRATARVRAGDGKVWVFDPTGTADVAAGQQLRWSPLAVSAEWDTAQLMARAMCGTVGVGVSDGSHWARRAQALLAPMLHAAARGQLDMEHVLGWVMGHDFATAHGLLEDNHASRLAVGSLVGVANTAARERSSIFSAAADALDAYSTRAGMQTTKRINFNARQFVQGSDTIYMHAPAEHQAAVTPIVCSLLAEIRRQTYLAHREGRLPSPVFFCLDEVANIAPIAELPSIASEGGGQGLKLLAAIQDLSQARYRWGDQADGFLTLFGTKILLPGISDQRTLESVSIALGEYDREMVSHTYPVASVASMLSNTPAHRSQTVSTQRQRVLSPGEIANIPARRMLTLDGVHWRLVISMPAHSTEPWVSLTAPHAR